MQFECYQGRYQAATKAIMKIHDSSLHQDLKHICNVCGYHTVRKGNLTKHHQGELEENKHFAELVSMRQIQKDKLKTS